MGIVVLEFDTSAHSVARMRERLHPNSQAFRTFVEIPDSVLGFQVICVVFQLVLGEMDSYVVYLYCMGGLDARGVAGQKVTEGQASPHQIIKIIHDCKTKKANDPMVG